jgi:hypothetical protein
LEAALQINREIGMREWETGNLLNLGKGALLQGEIPAATAWLTQALTLSQELDYKIMAAETLEAFADLGAREAQSARAARLWGASEVLRETIGSPIPHNDRPAYDRGVEMARQEAGESAFAMWWAAGRVLSMQQAIEMIYLSYPIF